MNLAIYDILAGPVCPIHFPVPWASQPEDSHLVTTEELRPLLVNSSFTIESRKDTTDIALAWFSNVSKKIQQSGLCRLVSTICSEPASRLWRIIKERTLKRAALCWLRSWQENNGTYSAHAMITRRAKIFLHRFSPIV
jgi:hypothetical protein